MPAYTCPFRDNFGSFVPTCKADGEVKSLDMDHRLCNTSSYESCPIYQMIMGKR